MELGIRQSIKLKVFLHHRFRYIIFVTVFLKQFIVMVIYLVINTEHDKVALRVKVIIGTCNMSPQRLEL